MTYYLVLIAVEKTELFLILKPMTTFIVINITPETNL